MRGLPAFLVCLLHASLAVDESLQISGECRVRARNMEGAALPDCTAPPRVSRPTAARTAGFARFSHQNCRLDEACEHPFCLICYRTRELTGRQ